MSETLLEAGAILSATAGLTGLDAVTARSYHHPALDGRTVVRLVGAAVGPAEDLTMEFLGFAPAGEPVEVGHARRQALGFPAWALVHDPANGRHALALVKEMEKLARVARGKPGNAKDGYDTLAVRLGAAAPQFLPTFWEQAGRAFLTVENQRMAGTCFAAARRAEQVHGLVIDEDRVGEVHLEFAFAGALTAAMLTEYTRGVVDRRPPAEAYELVKTLSLRRVAGGLPPHTSMAGDLAKLARAAGLDAEREADEVVTRLLTYPAMIRASLSVWKAYRKPLVRLGRRDPAVRGRLLDIFPEPPAYDPAMLDQWLELLEATGATAELVAAPGEGSWPGSAGQWLKRCLAFTAPALHHGGRRRAALLALTERMLPRLAAEGGAPLADHPARIDLDVLDLCRAAGVPVPIDPADLGRDFSVGDWARDDQPGRRDLAAVAADPQLRPMLVRGVRWAIRQLRGDFTLTGTPLPESVLREALGVAGVREVLSELLIEQTGRTGDGTVADLDDDLTFLAAFWSSDGMALAPDGFRRLPAVDVAAVLGRTLRGGLAAELSWPAYEEVAAKHKNFRIGYAWPELVVHDEQSAHVITPDGRVTEHVFRYPPARHPQAPTLHSITNCWFVDGDLLVIWWSADGPVAYWSSRPDELIPVGRADGFRFAAGQVPLPLTDGGVTTGSRPVHAGDVHGPAAVHPLVSDGQAFWRLEAVYENYRTTWQWREFDPRTGDAGRISLPAFFAAGPPEEELEPHTSHLRPAPAEFASSPLGWHDGLVGWRSARTAEGTAGAGVDGRRAALPPADGRHDNHHRALLGALSLPGSPDPRPLTSGDGHRGRGVLLWSPDGGHLLGQEALPNSMLPPLEWWHALQPRDEKGSAVLRSIDDRTAAALLDIDESVTGTMEVRAAVEATIAAHLPAVTDPKLLARIAEKTARAVRLRRRIAEVSQHLEPRPARARPVPSIPDSTLREAWDGLGARHTYYHSGTSGVRYDLLRQVQAVGVLFQTGDGSGIPAVPPVWTGLLRGLGAIALRAAAATTGETDREALAAFLATVAETPLIGGDVPMRVVKLVEPRMATSAEVTLYRKGTGLTVVFPPDQYVRFGHGEWTRTAIQSAPDGEFVLPPGVTIRDEARIDGRWTAERLRRFCTLLAERGPAPWRAAAAEELAATTGMTAAEASMLLAGLPGINNFAANFLTPEQRRVLGINATQAKVARAGMWALSIDDRLALLDAAMPADPADLWRHGPDVAAIARVWISLRGRRVAVPDELIAGLARVVDNTIAAGVLQAIAGPADGDWLSTDGRTRNHSYWNIETTADTGQAFDNRHLIAVGAALPWLAYHLRWDDPLRAVLPEALRLTRLRLRNPDLLVGRGAHPAGERPEVGPALVDGSGTPAYTGHHVAPAKLSGPDDPALAVIDDETSTALRTVLSGWIDEVLSTPEGAAGDPHDPVVSAPALVDEVRARFGVPADAAAYYLQVLALPDPADKAVLGWNGWKPARLRAAQQALVAGGQLVAAKRQRAGRAVFLPGGWLPAKAPKLPLEAWKQPLYRDDTRQRTVTRTLPELFAAAWARVVAGDLPRYRNLEEKP